MKSKRIRLCCAAVFSIVVAVASYLPFPASGGAPASDGLRKVLETGARLAPRAAKTYPLPALDPGKIYSLGVSLPAPDRLQSRDGLSVALRDGQKTIASKMLHAGDPDLYTLFRASEGSARIEIASAAALAVEHSIVVVEWPSDKSAGAALESEPNDSWREANPIALGADVWASADDKPYIIAPVEEAANRGTIPYQQAPSDAENLDRLPEGGIDWFKFDYDGDRPKLVYFEVDLLERDNIPVDVSIYTIENGEAKVYEKGADPVTPPHEVQALAGNKFTTRTITRGTYYVRVDANHPFYRLKTSVYDAPPYNDARLAVRAGADYLLGAGDSWHANTPRHGGIVNRVSSVHAETTTCIACHATHFTTRAALVARQNGYGVFKRPQLQFLAERLYNNPRPFYGHPDASWARVISASANVLSRLAALLNVYENELSGERRLSLLKGVGGYLKIYYKGRTLLPKDESNGNTPLVSAYEVAFYSWKVFDELYRQAGDEESMSYRDRVRGLIEQDNHKNLVDLCYQTIALATIDPTGYAEKIRRNAERLLELQRPDAQWSMLFEPGSPTVEFQTGHVLYTLALAGYPADYPKIAEGLKLLLRRQQEFGGWFDPHQSYENFRTPFRETQFAVMALSEYYKGEVRGKGWNAGFASPSGRLSMGDALLRLEQTDGVWERPAAETVRDLISGLGSADALIRAASAAALGRVGGDDAAAPLSRALGDASKMVQIAAAQALRRIAERRISDRSDTNGSGIRSDAGGVSEIAKALGSRDARVRWGATRVFAQHFSQLTERSEFAAQLIDMLSDPHVTVRMQAAKALAQWFYWTKDENLQDRIADAFIARMAAREHPWMRRNLLEGFYSLADENVRYLYDNWIALIAEPEDRERAVKGHRESSRRMAERIARSLVAGNELQREGLLRGLTEFHLRSSGYANAGRYTRIGNDVETVRFYPEGAPALERALIPALRSPNAERRRQAILAAYTLRDNKLSDLPLLVMQRLIDPDAKVRGAAEEFYRALPLSVAQDNRRRAAAALRELLASNRSAAQVAALDRIKTLGSDFAVGEGFDAEIKAFVLNAGDSVAPAALRAVADFPALGGDAQVQARIASALESADQELLRAGVQLVLARPELRQVRPVAAALDTVFKTTDAPRRRLVLGLIGGDVKVEEDLRLLNLVVDSLGDGDEQVRAAGLGVVRRVKSLQSNASVRAAVAVLMKDPNQRLQGQAIALYQGQDGSSVAVDGTDASRLLNYEFFVSRVMPILERRGADGNACVNCHSSHAIFRLHLPGASGKYSDEMLRDNYRSALKVVDLTAPENSLILRKPTSNADQEGVVGARKLSHGGGQRWGADDAAYRTILEWINGARVK
ncbi:MAG: hypothetical protein KIT57_15625 [Blastocatellales bacterium]|nr:hypothetical protein [Blastocatellales bacterium]